MSLTFDQRALLYHMKYTSIRLETREEQEAHNNLCRLVYERLVDTNSIPVGTDRDKYLIKMGYRYAKGHGDATNDKVLFIVE